ncbi:MAG: GGDEF domain-containing protein [Candidatus Paracaedibacter sp.]
MAILGWYTDNHIFYQMRSNLTPMYFNIALSFVVLGLGLVMLVTKHHQWSALLGISLILFSGIVLLQYILNVDLRIDNFFYQTDPNLGKPVPGRMSPNSALCFMACGFALILLSLKKSPQMIYYLALALGIGVLVLAATSLLGYAADLSSTYQWAKLTPMALYTAIGFIIASSGIVAFVYSKDSLEDINLSSKSPYLAAVFVCCLTFLLWKASLHQGMERLNDLISLESDKIKELVITVIDERVSDMEELKLHVEYFPQVSKRLWENAIDFYIHKNPIFKTIKWIDPIFENQEFMSLNSSANHSLIQSHLDIAKNNGKTRISNIFQLKPDEREMYLILPLFKNNTFRGYIISSINVDIMIQEILKEVQSSKFEVAFFESKAQERSFFKSSTDSYSSISSVREIPFYNSLWVVKVWPSTELFNKYQSTLLSKLIVIAGIILALFLFSVIRARQIINKQALILQKTENILKEQLGQSSKHAKELRLLKEMTDAIQLCSSLNEANVPIKTYCELLLPGTSGILYLSNDLEGITQFTAWGMNLPKVHSFPFNNCIALKNSLFRSFSGGDYGEGCQHVQTLYSTSSRSINLCLPITDQNKILGLLSIHDYHQLSPMNADHKKILLFLETLVNQLSLSISAIKMRDLLKDQATRDPLTNLFNRRYLEETLQRELHRAQRHSTPVSIIMIDIDHFKNINDTYGHDGGDEVLARIGLLLQKYYRKSDIACRFGGEEFILVLPEMNLDIAVERAETIRLAAESLRLTLRGQEMKGLTISLGVATYPQHGMSIEALISAADKALYRAKSSGRNRMEVAQRDHFALKVPSQEAI